jgi:hypothetical protein
MQGAVGCKAGLLAGAHAFMAATARAQAEVRQGRSADGCLAEGSSAFAAGQVKRQVKPEGA